ncbi:MAG TPA: hypothetical protein VNY08_08140 [Bradyrhizobium sp.]|nr:hypothetical protein [Bradyrhizobium sp.]
MADEQAIAILRAAINAISPAWEWSAEYSGPPMERLHAFLSKQRGTYIELLHEALSEEGEEGLSEQSKEAVNHIARPSWVEETEDFRVTGDGEV